MALGFFNTETVDPAAPLTPGAIERKRKIAELLMKQGSAEAPIQSWTQGANRVAQSLLGAYQMKNSDAEEAAGRKASNEQFAKMLAGFGGGGDNFSPPAAAPQSNPSPMAYAGTPTAQQPTPGAPKDEYAGMDPAFRDQLMLMQADLQDAGIDSRVISGHRDHGKQDALFAQGRTTPGNIVTNAPGGSSFHNYGMAADLSPYDRSQAQDMYRQMRDLAPANGLKWGGTFSNLYDPAHVQMGGRSLADLKGGGGPAMALAAATPQGPAQAAIGQAAPQGAPMTPPGANGGMPAPQATPNIVRALASIASDPWLSDSQKSMAMMLAKDKMGPQFEFVQGNDGTFFRKNNRAGTIEPYLKAPSKPTWGVIGKDQFGRDQMGWIDPNDRSVTPGQPQAAQGQPVSITGPDGNPVQVPPGMDPVEFQKTFSKRAAEDAAGPKSDDVTSLRKEVQNLPSYKNLAQAAPIYDAMRSTADTDSKASDLNLVYGLGKIMDPGSVVREGEMVMVKNAASLPDWLVGAINGLSGGQVLTPETRQAILREAHNRVSSYKGIYDKDVEQYTGIAKRRRMDPQDVITNFGPFEPWSPAKKAPPAATAAPKGGVASPKTKQEYDALPSGARFVDPNGEERIKP